MDIVVKSFYRPYYLERCLRSIYRNVQGKFTLTVIDDGTPQVYLDRIRELFPSVKITKSSEYKFKVELIDLHLANRQVYIDRSIPVQSWKECIESCGEYFLLLEEDAWITSPISLDRMLKDIESHELLIVKLGWNNSSDLITGRKEHVSNEIEELIPDLPFCNLALVRPWFKDTFRVRSLLARLGVVDKSTIWAYYTLYTVSSAIYKKVYWQYIWEDAEKKIDEATQLFRSLKWYEEFGGKYAKTVQEHVKTSFITASVNRFKSNQFDMLRLNYILNEAWLNNELDAMCGFPDDFDLEMLKRLVTDQNDSTCTVADWNSWIYLFKGQHKQAGSQIS